MNRTLNDAVIRLAQVEGALRGLFDGRFGVSIPGGKGGTIDKVIASLRQERDHLLFQIKEHTR